MSSPAESSDQRRAPRLRSLKGARLVLPNRVSTFQCTVRNISSTGVCVEMPSTFGVLNRMTLRMDDGSADRECEVVWRTETRLGLKFI